MPRMRLPKETELVSTNCESPEGLSGSVVTREGSAVARNYAAFCSLRERG